jgi:hydrogenase maturation protease
MRATAALACRVIGVGNPLRGDDGAGPAVVRRLRDQPLPGVQLVEVEGDVGSLIEALRGCSLVILVDAVRCGVPPGTILRMDASSGSLPPPPPSTSTHGLGPGEAIELARAMGQLPRRLIVYGIEGRDFVRGRGLTPEVEMVLEEVCRRVRDEVAVWRREGAAGAEGAP